MAHQDTLIATDIESYLTRHENKELLRFITCGSVDDGKSTLIGRLLHDSKMIFEDHMESIVRESKKKGSNNGEIDLALLVDGLQSEREQGITIDVAYRYFSTEKRKFIIADTPGHEQYTRNMATGASTADLAIILIDASHGVQVQTRRHSFIVKLLGIKHVIIAINKMDVVNYSQEIFENIRTEYTDFANELGLSNFNFIPISALKGDNIVKGSAHMPWHMGDSLMNILDNIDTSQEVTCSQFNFPVQYVNRPNQNFRGYAGTIISGNIKVGDDICVYPSGKTSKVESIVTYDGDLDIAYNGMAITLTLKDEIDISRGDVIVKSDEQVTISNSFDVNIVWMSEESLIVGKDYLIKRASSLISGAFESLHFKTDVNTFKQVLTDELSLNEIGHARLVLIDPVVFLSYAQSRKMGNFIIIDRVTNDTVGVGMIVNKTEDSRDELIQKTQTAQSKSEYSEFEVEFNALVRKHFPHWKANPIN